MSNPNHFARTKNLLATRVGLGRAAAMGLKCRDFRLFGPLRERQQCALRVMAQKASSAERCERSGKLVVGMPGLICLTLLALASCQSTVSLPGVPTPTTQTQLTLSGYLEGTDVNVVPEVSAQILELSVEEGDRVTAEQVVVKLDDALLQAQREQSVAALMAAQAALTETLAGPRPEAVAAAQADVTRAKAEQLGARQAVTDTKSILARPPGLAAQITEANTQVKLAEQDVQRADEALVEEGYVLAQQKAGTTDRAIEDQKHAALEADKAAAQAQLDGARAYLAALQKLRQAPVDLIANVHAAQSQVAVADANITMTQASLAVAGLAASPEEIAQSQAGVQTAQANLALIDAQLAKYTLVSPITGVVTHKLAHAGEVSQAGMPLLVVSDISQLTLKVYVPETEIGHLAQGQRAEVTVDAYPGQVFVGTVSRIAREAEFTPSNVQTRADRAKLVFAVKVLLPNADGRLKAGMPADVVFQLR
jgi:HlyD family secretion protein